MIYSKNCLLRAIEHVVPALAGRLPKDMEYGFDEWVDIIGVASAVYFVIEDYEELNPSVKYAFVIIKHVARELQYNNGVIDFGDEEVEFLGDPLVI